MVYFYFCLLLSQLYIFSEVLLTEKANEHKNALLRGCSSASDFLITNCLTENEIYYSVSQDGEPLDFEKALCENGEQCDDRICDSEINCVLGLLA